MKLQHLAVIFIIIIMPISMVISTYVNNLIDVANKEAQYNSVLMNSTYDAVRAYQINTLNNTFASVNSSKVRDINASINSFFNSLATSLSSSGYSKNELESYVPAILFTLYDGFYLYGPFDNYTSANRSSVKYNDNANTEYGLKPYNYYTCEYEKDDSYHIIINYTLDNYISVCGTYKNNENKDEYITASGYYIDTNKIHEIDDENKTVTLNDGTIIAPETLGEYVYAYNSKRIEQTIGSKTINLQGKLKYYRYMNYNEEKYYYDDSMDEDDLNDVSLGYMKTKDEKGNEVVTDRVIPIFYLDKNLKIYISDNMLQTLADERGCTKEEIRNGSKFQDVNNYYYYKKAAEFSEKVYPALSKIDIGTNNSDVIKSDAYNNDGKYKVDTQGDDGEQLGTTHIKYNYGTSAKIFDYTQSGNDPETDSSLFNEHRMDVIISTIEANLASSISNFNKYQYNSAYDYRMPTVTETDWEKIANNVNIVAFLQGFAVGNYKFYNNYSVVSDTKNKEFISKEAILVQKNIVWAPPYNEGAQASLLELYRNNNNNSYYHDPRCKDFHNSVGNNVIAYRLIDYEADSFSHDFSTLDAEGNISEESEAVNYYMQSGTGGYECIVSRNTEMFSYDELITGSNTDINPDVRTAYLSALAREKGAAFKNLQLLNYNTDNINSQ